MAIIKTGTKFFITDNNVLHCLDGEYTSNSCISNITKEYKIISIKNAELALLNNPLIRKCEHCMSAEDIEIE